eukprot:scpid42759/ scgid7928/ 
MILCPPLARCFKRMVKQTLQEHTHGRGTHMARARRWPTATASDGYMSLAKLHPEYCIRYAPCHHHQQQHQLRQGAEDPDPDHTADGCGGLGVRRREGGATEIATTTAQDNFHEYGTGQEVFEIWQNEHPFHTR